MNRNHGFSLIELMIAVAIIGILAAFAYPTYLDQVLRGRRAAAQAEMMELATREQQFLLANRAYASRSDLEASGYALPAEIAAYYNWAITLDTGTLPGYTITFTASGAQARDGDLSLTSTGIRSPAAKW